MPKSKSSVFIGLDLGGTDLKYGLVAATGKILVSKKIRAKVSEGQKPMVEQLRASARELLSIAALKKWKVGRIGVGSPGAVNFETGKVVGNSPNIPGWEGVNLKKSLRMPSIPAYADNDANCVALAESLFGAARNSQSALCVTVGTGIGGGLVLNGKIYRGASFSAGEIGHTTLVLEGKQCACGNRGCLEKYASVSALMEKAVERGFSTVRALTDAAKKQDSSAVGLIAEQAGCLGAGLASATNLLNPEKVILGGGFVDVFPLFLKLVENEIRKRAFPAALLALKVVKAKLGNEAGLVGAAFLGSES
ncbi:MAG: ROK family protein [candidate division Zixibacteria bacterium]|nr:ROK family protein [candidate division Zixibacteria bacterium]